MRFFPLLLLCISFAFTSTAQTRPDVARVRMAQGKYVFYYNQPVAAYDVAFSFTSTYRPSEKMTLNDLVSGGMAGALTEAGAQLKPFDAIIVQAGQRDIAIKFKDTVSATDRALATVRREGGLYLFEYCEPVTDYKVLKTEKVAWFNKVFGGTYYTLTQVEGNLLKTAQKNDAVQAVVFNETASFVAFK